ncbi:Nonribosomal peptide synthetases (NRPS) [Penicillium verhagenii]|uniref:Nonribosomal peptide synthetases (NRPS) n=1 Tax=Penicillium verhagenii TaxID=1562060 RepID=UPI002545899A|nr:Nonribosomal peptide synthetases (NRPS) [Penicillium verhagenii]KAJ5930329.1 Nonribosomal peptide synthetases (NRPS) [Penicillium verhagenii]
MTTENIKLGESQAVTQGLKQIDYDQIWEWNKIVPAAICTPVQDFIQINVEAHPNAPAVCSWDGNLTYAELDDFSSRLANVLKDRGVCSEVIVPLCFEKSAWTIVAMLATIKAGGAFVLLDAKQPESRLRDIISLTKASFMISSPQQQALASKLLPDVITVSHNILLAMPMSARGTSEIDPESTLFVVFTSGSTGLPKGVMSSHRSFVSGVHYRKSILEVPSPRVFDFASYSFDVSTDIILSTLMIGGCICVPSELERQNDVAGAINRLEVNSADLTPSVARLIDPDTVPGLKILKLGGELSSVSDVARWAPKLKLVNVYGPSECLLIAINVLTEGSDPRTIGKGHGAVTWIVDPEDHDKLVPIGATGELVVEGPIVTKGYLHDLERTAKVFIEAPEWLQKGQDNDRRSGLLYKTGDLVHYNPDGTLNFVGRKDTQVKVRGQRVELSEVEHHIQQQVLAHTGKLVNPVVDLITVGEAPGRPTLVGFLDLSQVELVEPEHEQQLRQAMWDLTQDLNKSLLKTLPQYMIPSVYIPIWKFPLNASGKTDRRKLKETGSSYSRQELAALRSPPSFVAKGAATDKVRSPPRTITEQRIQRMWSAILNLQPSEITREDHFFKLGGDSLNAIQLATLATSKQLSLTVEAILTNPVLSRMAIVAKPL